MRRKTAQAPVTRARPRKNDSWVVRGAAISIKIALAVVVIVLVAAALAAGTWVGLDAKRGLLSAASFLKRRCAHQAIRIIYLALS